MRGLLLAMRAFAAAMFGVRKRSKAEDDRKGFGPAHAVAAGILMVAAFVAVLLSIVHLITGKHP